MNLMTLNVRKMEWTHTETATPKENQDVLVFCEAYHPEAFIAKYNNNGEWIDPEIIHEPIIGKPVTHWMPLPEPPKER